MTTPKLNLNLNEENELAFKISIEGSSSDIGATKPKFRLVVSEQDNGWGMIYPAEQGDDGNVVVRLPSTENFLEEVNYRGKLEVILGNHYFVPTEVDIEFTRPLKVEAVVITSGNKGSTLREEKAKNESGQTSVSVSAVEVRNKKSIKEVNRQPERPVAASKKPAKRTWDDLSETEQKALVRQLKEQKLNKLRQQKKLEENRKKSEQSEETRIEERFKDQLKDLMSSSLLSDDED